jgi:hypothetical protein
MPYIATCDTSTLGAVRCLDDMAAWILHACIITVFVHRLHDSPGKGEREREKGDRCVYSIYYPRKYMLWECTGRASVCWLACETASVGARESGAVCGP